MFSEFSLSSRTRDALNDLDYEFTSNDSDTEIKDYYI